MENKTISNSEIYPEAWAFFTEHARNLEGTEFETISKYRIPKPDLSGDFIYANCTSILFVRLTSEFYKPSLNSHSVYGQIQYIVRTFK